MAKWGEGDPRWIVEERADAKNVNNWHWTEKNATQWSIDTIKKLLNNFHAESDEFICEKLDVTKCEGEAQVNNRKGKLIFFYEWQIEAEWSGRYKSGDNKTKFRGNIEIPNLSEEYTIDEVDVSVSCTSSSKDGDAIRKFMQTVGTEIIKEKLNQYLTKLKDEYSQNLILPTKTPLNPSNGSAVARPTASTLLDGSQNDLGQYAPPVKDLSSREITLTQEFFCTPDDLYKVLTTQQLVEAFTRGNAVVESSPGGHYSIFGGNVTGTFVSLTPGKAIEMKWRKKDWPEGHHSRLLLELETNGSGTRLRLTQNDVPSYDWEGTMNGWKTNFFEAVKQTYGYGGRFF